MHPSVSSLLRAERHPVEVFALLALAFVLPLVEAPKTIFAALFALAWVIGRVRERDWGGRWDVWDTMFALWFASGLAVATFAGIKYHEWRGASDLLRYVALGWLVKRGGYNGRTLVAVLVALVVGTACALVLGYWVWFLRHLLLWEGNSFLGLMDVLFRVRTLIPLELKSVGHVNHSAIYLAIMAGTAAGLAMSFWHRLSCLKRIGAVVLADVLRGVPDRNGQPRRAGRRRRRRAAAELGMVAPLAVCPRSPWGRCSRCSSPQRSPSISRSSGSSSSTKSRASCFPTATRFGKPRSPLRIVIRFSASEWTTTTGSRWSESRAGGARQASRLTPRSTRPRHTDTACTSTRSPSADGSASACSLRRSSRGRCLWHAAIRGAAGAPRLGGVERVAVGMGRHDGRRRFQHHAPP